MAKNRLFKPHRGNKSTMNTGIKKTMVLAAGEMFIEVPDTGQGTGHCKMKIGDGMNIYPNLPYAMGDITNDIIEVIEEDESPDVETALNKIKSGAKLNTIISALKRINVLLNVAISRDIIQKIYPVGSIFLTTSNIDPGTYLGGTWELMKDKFLIGAGGSYTVGNDGGSTTAKLTLGNLPSHTHSGSIGSSNASNGIHQSEAEGGSSEFPEYQTDRNKFTTAWLKQAGNKITMTTQSDLKVLCTRARGTNLEDMGTYTFSHSGGSHSHSLTINASGSSNPNAFSIMPPYAPVYMWKRIA